MRALALASLLGCAAAQLAPWPRAELSKLAAEGPARDVAAEAEVKEGFVHPTICDPSVRQTAGYISVSPLTKYFFWLFESRSNATSDPLIIWLSGGPGCSSQLALFAENGPCKVSKDGARTTPNPHSWNANAHVLWLDQPDGVGFSTGFGTRNEVGVAKNMYAFLQGFLRQFPGYQARDLYIFGESYAGHYVPNVAHKIWRENKAGANIRVPLKGIGIGNGLTEPGEQYKWYPEMGTTGARAEGGHAPAGVINPKEGLVMKAALPACLVAIHYCNKGIHLNVSGGGWILNTTACLGAYELCNVMSQIPYELTGKNPYDMRIPCEHGRLCYDFDMIATYLNQPSVQQQLGVRKKWGSCNMAVDLLFVSAGDWMINFGHLIPDLLADGIRTLIYAGDVDYICNWLGNMKWTLAMDWPHKADFNAAPNNDYTLGGETVAKLRTSNGFSFMQVFNAGHLMPMDQPEVALQMVKDFTSGKLDGTAVDRTIVV